MSDRSARAAFDWKLAGVVWAASCDGAEAVAEEFAGQNSNLAAARLVATATLLTEGSDRPEAAMMEIKPKRKCRPIIYFLILFLF